MSFLAAMAAATLWRATGWINDDDSVAVVQALKHDTSEHHMVEEQIGARKRIGSDTWNEVDTCGCIQSIVWDTAVTGFEDEAWEGEKQKAIQKKRTATTVKSVKWSTAHRQKKSQKKSAVVRVVSPVFLRWHTSQGTEWREPEDDTHILEPGTSAANKNDGENSRRHICARTHDQIVDLWAKKGAGGTWRHVLSNTTETKWSGIKCIRATWDGSDDKKEAALCLLVCKISVAMTNRNAFEIEPAGCRMSQKIVTERRFVCPMTEIDHRWDQNQIRNPRLPRFRPRETLCVIPPLTIPNVKLSYFRKDVMLHELGEETKNTYFLLIFNFVPIQVKNDEDCLFW